MNRISRISKLSRFTRIAILTVATLAIAPTVALAWEAPPANPIPAPAPHYCTYVGGVLICN